MSQIKKKAVKYVGGLVFGSVLEQLGRKYTEQQDPNQKREYVSKQGKQYGEVLDKPMRKSFDDTYVQSFDVRRWEAPKIDPDLLKTIEYVKKTNRTEQREDLTKALTESAKKTIKELPSKPRETVEKLQKIKGQYDAFNQDGTALQEHSSDLVKQKGAEMVRSVGMNSMLKAPGYLIPGLPGFLYRNFFNAKMVGNFGKQWNELQEAHSKTPGTWKQQRDTRLESIKKSNESH